MNLPRADANLPPRTLPEPEVLAERTIFECEWIALRGREVRFPSGLRREFLLKDEPQIAVCLPVTPEGLFVLVEEYRHGPRRALFELPGGIVDAGEDAAAAAARETLEETGYAGSVQHLASTWISAYSNARKHIYLMRDARRVGEPHPEPHELSRVLLATRGELEAVLRAGELSDLDAALLALRELERAAQ